MNNPRVQYWRERQRENELRRWEQLDRVYVTGLKGWRRVLWRFVGFFAEEFAREVVNRAQERGQITVSQADAMKTGARFMVKGDRR